MRVQQLVNSARTCTHCNGSGKCFCETCGETREERAAQAGLEVAANACARCYGRGKEQEMAWVLAPPSGTVKTHQKGERSKRPPPKKPIRAPSETRVITRSDWKKRGT